MGLYIDSSPEDLPGEMVPSLPLGKSPVVLLATCGAAGTVMILLEASRFLLTGVRAESFDLV